MSTINYKCSVFCSFYKGEKFIQGYLEDVLKQSVFKSVEFLFLDCNSPENEKDFILPLAKKYDNIVYHKLDADPGLYQAWNIAIEKCSSKIIGNWNVDDRKSINSIEFLLKEFERNPQLDVSYGITYVSTMANERYEDNNFNLVYPCLPHSLENLLRNNSPHCMPLWKKDLHYRFGLFDTSYTSAADGEFWLRCAFGGAIIKMLNHPIGLYYHNPQGRSTNPETMKELLEEVRRSREPYISILKNQNE
jgi:glycosyltransferase involved in cell wall biosynthesis